MLTGDDMRGALEARFGSSLPPEKQAEWRNKIVLAPEQVTDIQAMCSLVGRNGDAALFIAAKFYPQEVADMLLTARADAQERYGPMNTGHPVGAVRSSDPNDPDGWAASA